MDTTLLTLDFTVALKTLLCGSPAYPAWLAVGQGGDLNTAGVDTGARVAPDASDAAMRTEVARFPLMAYNTPGTSEITYTAVVPHTALNSTWINEFGVLNDDGALLLHHIPVADGTGKTTRYSKTAALRWIVEFAITLTTE